MKRKNNLYEVFDQFCKERHAEDKGENFNLLQEVYANTELFDLSNFNNAPIQNRWGETGEYSDMYNFYSKHLINQSLPFSACFCKLIDVAGLQMYVFVREYEPLLCTGTFVIKNENQTIGNVPFSVYSEDGSLIVERNLIDQMWQVYGQLPKKEDYMNFVLDTFVALCNLPKYAVASDTPTNHSQYYPRRQAQGIKVVNRPIYYILEKKEERKPRTLKSINPMGRLEFTHAFKVRGHYMRINPKSIGKDRNGIRRETLKGLTWRVEHIKGDKEFIKKLRIIK